MLGVFMLLITIAISVFIYTGIRGEIEVFFRGIIFTSCVVFAIIAASYMWGEPMLKPIDVYRGKTTLQITYQDSVAIDSVVVFKTKEE